MVACVEIPTGHAATPLVVLGRDVSNKTIHRHADAPIYVFEHQCSGHACALIKILGVGLLLEHNCDRMPHGAEVVVAGFKTFGEWPQEPEAALSARVASWLECEHTVPTIWAPDLYDQIGTGVEAEEFGTWMRRDVAPEGPPIEQVCEGLATSIVLNSMPDAFAEWRVLTCLPEGRDCHTFSSDSDASRHAPGPPLRDIWPRLEALTNGTDLRAYLLWANSD